MRHYPRPINAQLVDVGDTIEVEHKPTNGITTIYRGTVDRRHDLGSVKRMLTKDGAVLLSWEVGKPLPKVTLLNRILEPHSTLEGILI